ncbi:MAG: hypothetical protein IBX50_19980 [Marinospirillum sp.]|nr:hypothetical protein [Marinospirillum sp.]
MSDSRSLQIRGEYKKELEEALYFYQQRGEPLKSEWDVMCALSVRMDSLLAFNHLGYESSMLAQIMRFALKYYTDPIAELTRIGRDYDWDLNHYFSDHPPTRRAVTTSSHPSYMRVIEPLIPPHLGSNTYNRLTAINGGLDMEELWYAYLPNYLKEDIKNHQKEKNEYLQSRTLGDEKKIRELMLSGDFYTLNDHLYNHFWGKDDYEKDEKEFRMANILDRDENYDLEMRMRVQSGMAKIAAELVPYILERNEYNAVRAVDELSS